MDTQMMPCHLPKYILLEAGLPEGLIDLIFEYHGTIAIRFHTLFYDNMEQVRPFTKYMTEHHYNLNLWEVQRNDRFTYTDHAWILQIKTEMLDDIIHHGAETVYLCEDRALTLYPEKRWCKVVGKTPNGHRVMIEDHKSKYALWVPFKKLYNFIFVTRTYNEDEIATWEKKGSVSSEQHQNHHYVIATKYYILGLNPSARHNHFNLRFLFC